MDLETPEKFGEAIRRKMPKSLGGILWNIGIAFAWYNLFVSFFGAIKDLSVVIKAANWIIAHGAFLVPVFRYIWRKLHICVEWWRNFSAPIRHFMHTLLPFRLSEESVDILMFFLSSVPLFGRYFIVSIFYNKSLERRERAVRNAGEKARRASARAAEAEAAAKRVNDPIRIAKKIGKGILGLDWLENILIALGLVEDQDKNARNAAIEALKESREAAESARDALHDLYRAEESLNAFRSKRKQSLLLLITCGFAIALIILVIIYDRFGLNIYSQ